MPYNYDVVAHTVEYDDGVKIVLTDKQHYKWRALLLESIGAVTPPHRDYWLGRCDGYILGLHP